MTKTNEKIIEEIKQKSVKERTNQEHQILIKHYGGVRKYLLSMGNFKDVDISENTNNEQIIEEVMKEHGMNYDIETSFDKSLKKAIQTALNLKDKEFQGRIQELENWSRGRFSLKIQHEISDAIQKILNKNQESNGN